MVLSKAITTFQQAQVRYASGLVRKADYKKFTIQGMKKNYAVIPLVVIMAIAMTGVSGFIVYSCRTRTDVSFNRSRPNIAEAMDMLNPEKTKIAVFNQEYRPMPELDAGLKACRED